MLGQMMRLPLTVASLLEHADRYHGDTEIVSRNLDGGIHRYTYSDAHRRSKQLAQALTRIGVRAGDRVATLAWNGYRHLELYYGVSGLGAVTHTINPRLFEEQLIWIINHAEDRVLFFDVSFAELVVRIAPRCPGVTTWVAMAEAETVPVMDIPNLLCYEDLLAGEGGEFVWPELAEESASSLCYTSGTTGNPKGVLYSHRSTLLHAFASCLPDAMNLSGRDVILPVVPMFHVNAWGIPYSAPMVGAKLVFPGAALDGESLCDLFESEGVTFTAGVPTVWLGVLQYLRESGRRLTALERMVVGGSACPPALMQDFDREYGIKLQHAWGMTELSPLGVVNTPKIKHRDLSAEERFSLAVKQGRPPFGIDIKATDHSGAELPRDGKAAGDLLVRGHWVIENYYRSDETPLVSGWFPTGDVANIDPDGFMRICDRSKDVIKSGGEWISSIELENIAMEHPAVAEAAAVGLPHPKWDERPLIAIVKKAGHDVDAEDILALYRERVAKFCIPDDVIFLADLPHTATGKVSKVHLREQLGNYCWPDDGSRHREGS